MSKNVQRPIDVMHLAQYVGCPIYIDYGDSVHRRWLKGIETLRGDAVAIVEHGLGPWMSEYGWGWQAWAKKPTEEDRAAYPLGQRLGKPCPCPEKAPSWLQRAFEQRRHADEL